MADDDLPANATIQCGSCGREDIGVKTTRKAYRYASHPNSLDRGRCINSNAPIEGAKYRDLLTAEAG
jgi:hypothetical protein